MFTIPLHLPPGLEAYSRSPDFMPDTLPAKFRGFHATKAGVWGVIHVIDGALRYRLEAPYVGEVVATAGETIVIEPAVRHRVEFVEPGRFYVEFFRSAEAVPPDAARNGTGQVLPHPLAGRPGSDPIAEAPCPRVHIETATGPSDEAIAERALQALFQGTLVLRERIRMTVAGGHVTLSGTVASEIERTEAERTVSGLDGVAGVTNLVAVQPEEWTASTFRGLAAAYGRDGESGSIPGRIEALFERDIEIGGTKIRITAQGGKVVLTGYVRSWRERDLAERVAWSAPGVTQIENRLVV